MNNVRIVYYCSGDYEYYDLDNPEQFSKYNEVVREAGSAGVDIGVESVDEQGRMKCLCYMNHGIINPDADYIQLCYVKVKGKDYDEETELAAKAACKFWHIDEKYWEQVEVEKEIDIDVVE